jgi:hypothetical protein
MKVTPDQTLAAQVAISVVAFIGLLVLGIYGIAYHNASVIPYAIGGMAAIYAHWSQSPAQQSTMTSLVQQLTPVLISLAQQQPAIPPTQPEAPKTT